MKSLSRLCFGIFFCWVVFQIYHYAAKATIPVDTKIVLYRDDDFTRGSLTIFADGKVMYEEQSLAES